MLCDIVIGKCEYIVAGGVVIKLRCWAFLLKRKNSFFFDHHKNDKNSLYHQFRRWGGIFIGLKFDSTVSYACWDLGGQKHAVGEFCWHLSNAISPLSAFSHFRTKSLHTHRLPYRHNNLTSIPNSYYY